MTTLSAEDITALEEHRAALIRTARASAMLAGLCRGAIRGCNPTNDPSGHVAKMLTNFLEMAGFEL